MLRCVRICWRWCVLCMARSCRALTTTRRRSRRWRWSWRRCKCLWASWARASRPLRHGLTFIDWAEHAAGYARASFVLVLRVCSDDTYIVCCTRRLARSSRSSNKSSSAATLGTAICCDRRRAPRHSSRPFTTWCSTVFYSYTFFTIEEASYSNNTRINTDFTTVLYVSVYMLISLTHRISWFQNKQYYLVFTDTVFWFYTVQHAICCRSIRRPASTHFLRTLRCCSRAQATCPRPPTV